MAQLINVRYFDEQRESWGMRRPSVPPNTLSNRSYSCAAIHLGVTTQLSQSEHAERVGALVTPTAASFVMLLQVSPPLYEALLKESWVRSYYGVTDLTSSTTTVLTPPANETGSPTTTEAEHGCVALIRRGINVDFVESLAKQFVVGPNVAPQPIIAIHMRQFVGTGSHSICLMHLNPTAEADQRMNYANQVLERMYDSDNVLVFSNFYQCPLGPTMTDRDFKVNVQWKRRSEYSDVADSGAAGASLGKKVPMESTVWWRSKYSKLVLEEVSPVATRNPSVFNTGLYLKYVSSNRDQQSPTNTPPPAGALTQSGMMQQQQQQFVDPAVVSAGRNTAPAPPQPRSMTQSGGGGVDVASLFANKAIPQQVTGPSSPAMTTGPTAPQQHDRWSISSMIALRNSIRANLSPDEQQYDLTTKFKNVTEAVENLNSRSFPWPCDYAIVNNTLLGAIGVPCEVSAFRNYVTSHQTPQQMMAAATQKQQQQQEVRKGPSAAGTTPESSPTGNVPPPMPIVAWSAPTGSSRQRMWSATYCSLIYQVTPKEMVFDITSDIGLASGNLKAAVMKLNQAGTGRRMADLGKPDRLADWRQDYALLYCPERSAYWLLAAMDVPCDIHACRYAVTANVTPAPFSQ